MLNESLENLELGDGFGVKGVNNQQPKTYHDCIEFINLLYCNWIIRTSNPIKSIHIVDATTHVKKYVVDIETKQVKRCKE